VNQRVRRNAAHGISLARQVADLIIGPRPPEALFTCGFDAAAPQCAFAPPGVCMLGVHRTRRLDEFRVRRVGDADHADVVVFAVAGDGPSAVRRRT